jgi:hypothetical protein
MLDEYEKKSELLYTIIIDAVTEKMSVEIIPYEIMVTSFRKAVFTIERRRIVVIYEESWDMRIVHDMVITYRK